MANQFSKTKIAAAVSAAAFGAGLSAPAGAVVVVGGNDGWEVSFDGNVNAFYTVGNYDQGYFTESADKDNARVHSGYLPAFFSFNVKSPVVNGVTGTARISFAPTIHNGGPKTQFSSQGGTTGPVSGINGATIDTREVVANLSGAFGEVSFGRTLSLFGRNAILNDMTLFGVGFVPGGDQFGSVTFGRTGHGYTYPDFAARFQYTTPNVAGFQAAIGIFDPSIIQGVSSFTGGTGGGGLLDETTTPRFEGEISYSGALFNGGTSKFWVDGLWQDVDSSCQGLSTANIGGTTATTANLATGVLTTTTTGGTTLQCGSLTASAWGVGSKLGFKGFEFVGYYHENDGLGLTAQFNAHGLQTTAGGAVEAREGNGYYLQGTYTFDGKTKVGVSYGEGNLNDVTNGGIGVNGMSGEVERTLWTVGVYHDVSSWLRVVAEYNHGELSTGAPGAATPEADTFSVGGFLFW